MKNLLVYSTYIIRSLAIKEKNNQNTLINLVLKEKFLKNTTSFHKILYQNIIEYYYYYIIIFRLLLYYGTIKNNSYIFVMSTLYLSTHFLVSFVFVFFDKN